MWSSTRVVFRRGWRPLMEPSRQKTDIQEWINAHRKFDKLLYEMMPSSFVEFQEGRRGYPTDLENHKDGVVVTHEDPMGLVMKEFFTPFFSGRLITPNLDALHKFGATEFQQDETSIKYKIDVKSFNPESLKIRLIGEMLTIDAKEEIKEEKDGSKRLEVKEMTKSFILPRGVHKEDIKTVLSEDGFLNITIPRPKVEELTIEKGEAINIEHEKKKVEA